MRLVDRTEETTFEDERLETPIPSAAKVKAVNKVNVGNKIDSEELLKSETAQTTIFDLGVDEPIQASVHAPNDDDIHTKDLISLTDVPLSNDDHVRMIEVMVPGVDGRLEAQKKHGKILHRRGPHPSMVMVKGQFVHRDDASALTGDVKSVMVDFTTVITYEGGVVLPIHNDVLHALISIWHARYRETGISSNQIKTTKADVARLLGIGINQRSRQSIEDALATIRGVTITKNYESPEGASSVNGSRLEVIGGIISNYTIDRHNNDGRGGRRSDTITVDFNQALVRAMCGDDTAQRPWIVRSLNLSKNLAYQTPWKRQLHRMVETRLDYQGRFQMPLRELWVECLGGSEEDPCVANRWRTIRFRIKEVFDEWVQSDWIKYFEWIPPRNGGAKKPKLAAGCDMNITLNEGKQGRVTVAHRRQNDEEGGWVRCEAGSAFSAGMGMRKNSLAWDLAKATTDSGTQAEQLLKKLGKDLVIDIAYGRLKSLITHMGERLMRLDIPLWLSPTYPVPDRLHVVRMAFRSWKFSRMQAEGSNLEAPFPAPFHDRRCALQDSIVRKKLAKYKTTDFLTIKENPESGIDPSLLSEVSLCTKLAVDLYLENSNGLSRTILDESNRIGDASLEREYQNLASATREIAASSAMALLWYKRIAAKPQIMELPNFGRNSPGRIKLLTSASKRLPEAFSLVKVLQEPDRNPWEAHVGSLLERRLFERIIEEDELAEVEKRFGG